jgi:prevent-host-death family protein
MIWQLQEAKQRFSELVRAAEAGEPQVVTKHGLEIVVVLDYQHYRSLVGEPANFMDYLRTETNVDIELDIDRPRSLSREIDLGDE